MTKQIIYAYISYMSQSVDKMINWCESNTNAYWYDGRHYFSDGTLFVGNFKIYQAVNSGLFIRFGFENEETATLFKLTWAGE